MAGSPKERVQKTLDHVKKLAGVQMSRQEVFLSCFYEIADDVDKIGEALKISFGKSGEGELRYALRSLELCTIIAKILNSRQSMSPNQYKTIAAEVKDANKDKTREQLDAAVVQAINNLPLAAPTGTVRAYIEDGTKKDTIDKMSVDTVLPGTLTLRRDEDEASAFTKRLPPQVNRGPAVTVIPRGKYGFLPYRSVGSQDLLEFGGADKELKGAWTNSISYCTAVVLLYGSLPDYQAATFAHLPGGNEAYINWDWMFLAGLPAHIKLKFAPGKPSRVVVVYAPANCDSTTLTCLKTLTDRGVAPGQITAFGFSSTAGNNFIFDRYGFFGMTRELLNQTQQYNWKPNAFKIG
jgi:hypothetical protein